MTTHARKRKTLIDDCRGSATTEAVIMMPFFLLVFLSVAFVEQRYERRLEAGHAARHAAWKYSWAGCTGDAPKDAAISTGSNLSRDDFFDGNASTAIEFVESWVPFTTPLFDAIIGKNITAERSVAVKRPGILGGGERNVNGGFVVACNEKSWDLYSEAGKIFCDLTKAPWC